MHVVCTHMIGIYVVYVYGVTIHVIQGAGPGMRIAGGGIVRV